MTRFALKAFSFEEFECRFLVMIAVHDAVSNANRGSQTILDRIKWNSKPPFAPNQGWSRAKAKTHHFPILDLAGRGYKFSTYFVQDCSSFMYLGVTLSEDLSWADHVTKNIMRKTNQRLGLITEKNKASLTITSSVDTLSFPDTSSFSLRWHYLGWQKQCYFNEQSSNPTKQGS